MVAIGGIMAGIFATTEAAAGAVLHAGVLAFAHRGIGLCDFPKILLDAAPTTAVVLLIAVPVAMNWAMGTPTSPRRSRSASAA